MKPRLFVGSASESLDVARAVHEELERDAEVTVWNQGVFDLTRTTLESLLDELARTEFSVFVFTPDDMARIRNVEYRVVRDNVVFELGMALGALGRERSFIIRPEESKPTHFPSDLLGVNFASYDPNRTDGRIRAAVAPACNRIRQAIQRTGGIPQRIPKLSLRIGISGSMCVGKKTLAAKLQTELNGRGDVEQVVVYQGVGREMIRAGRTSDGATAFPDYPAYFQRHLQNVNGRQIGCVLHVRTLFDTIAYAEVNGNFKGEWMAMAREMARLYSEKFAAYLYVPIEAHVPMIEDGVRSTDLTYQKKMDVTLRRVLGELMPSFVEIRGTVEQRVSDALAEIDRASGKGIA